MLVKDYVQQLLLLLLQCSVRFDGQSCLPTSAFALFALPEACLLLESVDDVNIKKKDQCEKER